MGGKLRKKHMMGFEPGEAVANSPGMAEVRHKVM
jgi:hypothetical protein